MLVTESKKCAVLGALMLVLLVNGGRQLIGIGPRTAPAATPTEAAGSENVAAAGRNAVSRALASMDRARGRAIVAVPASPELSRDLFRLDASKFPEPAQPAGSVDAAANAGVVGVESPHENADALRSRRAAQLVEETKTWNVRSVMLGSNPTAVIETGGAGARRALVRPGMSLQGWTVVEVAPGWALLEKEQVRVRLMLASPER